MKFFFITYRFLIGCKYPSPQTAELSQWQRRVSDLNNKISEIEDNLSKVQKELSKSQDQCSKLQRDLRENVAQKEDQVPYIFQCQQEDFFVLFKIFLGGKNSNP